jgi:hypothetical protein
VPCGSVLQTNHYKRVPRQLQYGAWGRNITTLIIITVGNVCNRLPNPFDLSRIQLRNFIQRHFFRLALQQLIQGTPCCIFRNCCNSNLMPRLPVHVLPISGHAPHCSLFWFRLRCRLPRMRFDVVLRFFMQLLGYWFRRSRRGHHVIGSKPHKWKEKVKLSL